jgi:hypothetical protein
VELQIGSLYFKTKSEAMKFFGTILSSSRIGASCPADFMPDMMDFSFRMCVSGKSPTTWANFCVAARNSISSQIIVFKTAAFLGVDAARCQITGEEIEWDSCHVDHVAPFSDLLQMFIEQRNIDTSIEHTKGGEDGSVTRIFIDATLDTQWKEFHKQNAVLRLTTVKANLSRPR